MSVHNEIVNGVGARELLSTSPAASTTLSAAVLVKASTANYAVIGASIRHRASDLPIPIGFAVPDLPSWRTGFTKSLAAARCQPMTFTEAVYPVGRCLDGYSLERGIPASRPGPPWLCR